MLASYLFLVTLLCVYAVHVYSTATIEQASAVKQDIENERQTMTVTRIFLNNLMASAPLLIPFIGIFLFLATWINTAHIIGLLSLAYGINPISYILALAALASPEFLAYSLLLAENIYLVLLAASRKGASTRLLTQSWKTVILYILLLFIGAVTEMMLIASTY